MATLRALGKIGTYDDSTLKYHIFAAAIEGATTELNGKVILFSFRNGITATGAAGANPNDYAILTKDGAINNNNTNKSSIAAAVIDKAVNWADYVSLGVSTGAGSNTQIDVTKFSPALPTSNPFNAPFLAAVGNLAILGTGQTIQSVEQFFMSDIDGDGKVTTEVVISEGLEGGGNSANSFIDDSIAYIKANPVTVIGVGSGVFILGDYLINKKKSFFYKTFLKSSNARRR
jgi:hypothetical protein